MIGFVACLTALIAGYFLYGKYLEKVFQPEKTRTTPAFSLRDGVDYVPMPTWKIFLIQFLNIAGLGPIFGAVMGAMYGPVVFLWITLGTIFAGGLHDYFSGMISERYNGESLPELVG
ncbi:MAG TPA: carbon starvation CstA family protein, partial [Bacteroidales bacterium]|nr:carbon starvation CstA family protein [Bacteroidales bacterium]